MIHIMTASKKRSTIMELEPVDFTDKIRSDLNKTAMVWFDLDFPEGIDQDQVRFEKETSIAEEFLNLEKHTILKYLEEEEFRPSAAREGSATAISLPYFSAIRHVPPLHSEKFIPIEISTDHFLIFFQHPGRIISVRTDPRSLSFECVAIVSNWMQQTELSSDTLDQVIVRLMDEIIDDNVELIRRFRMNVEYLEHDIIRGSTRTRVIEEVLKLKSISMILLSYILTEKRFLTRLQSSGIAGIQMTDAVSSLAKVTINEIDSQIGIVNDVNRVISDILNVYSLLLQDRLNNVLRLFTIFSVMLLIPTFIVGFFGMNNFGLFTINPLFTAFVVILLCLSIIVPLIILWRFKLLRKIRI